jgi:hypothetical protein
LLYKKLSDSKSISENAVGSADIVKLLHIPTCVDCLLARLRWNWFSSVDGGVLIGRCRAVYQNKVER